MTFPYLSFWGSPILVVGLECCVVAALAAVVQRALPQPSWQRAVWRAAFLCLLALLVSEWTGFGRGVVGSLIATRPQITPGPAQIMPYAYSEFAAGRIPDFINHGAPALRDPAVWWPGWLWLAGTAVVLLRSVTGQILLVALRFRRKEIDDPALRERTLRTARLIGLRGKFRLLRLPQSFSPVAFGWFKPAIGLPPDFESRFSCAEQEAILAHELAHLAARDPLWFWFADFATALLWWHPAVWWGRQRLRASSELAADEAAALVPDGPGCLARCLVDLAKRMTAAWGWAGINGGFRSNLGKRVERLAQMPATSKSVHASRAQRVALVALPLLMAPALAVIFGAVQAQGVIPNSISDAWNRSPASLLLAQLNTAPPTPPVVASAPSPSPASAEKELVVTVPTEGPFYFRSEPLTLDELQKRLQQASHENPQMKVWIHADRKAPWDRVKQVLDAAKAANITQISTMMSSLDQDQHPPARLQDAKLLFEMGHPNEAEQILNEILANEPANKSALYYIDRIKEWRNTNAAVQAQLHSWNDIDPNPWSRSNVLRRLERVRLDDFDCAGERLTNVLRRLADASRKCDPAGYGVNLVADQSVSDARISIAPALKDASLSAALEAVARGADRPLTFLVSDSFIAFLPNSKNPFQTRVFRVDPAVVRDNLRAMNASSKIPVSPGAQGKTADDAAQLNELLRSYLQSFGVSGLAQPDSGIVSSAGKSIFFNARSGLIMVRAAEADFQVIAQAIQALDSTTSQIVIEAKFVELSRQEGDALGFNWFLRDSATNFLGSMPDAQFRAVMDSILHHTSEDVLSPPHVVTLSGRHAHIGSDGMTLDVDATVIGGDGWTIQTTASASVGSGAQSWRVAGSHPLRDGETLVLGQLATNRPTGPKLELVFVTPSIIDRAGNLVHP